MMVMWVDGRVWGGAQAEGGGQQGHHQAHGQGVSWFGLIVSDLTQIHWEDSILESKFDLNDSTILIVLYIFNSILESKFFGPVLKINQTKQVQYVNKQNFDETLVRHI